MSRKPPDWWTTLDPSPSSTIAIDDAHNPDKFPFEKILLFCIIYSHLFQKALCARPDAALHRTSREARVRCMLRVIVQRGMGTAGQLPAHLHIIVGRRWPHAIPTTWRDQSPLADCGQPTRCPRWSGLSRWAHACTARWCKRGVRERVGECMRSFVSKAIHFDVFNVVGVSLNGRYFMVVLIMYC